MRLRVAIAVWIVLLAALAAGPARAVLMQADNVRITLDGSFAPRELPRDRLAPVRITVEGSIATTDGSHPPPLRRVEVALNRNGKLTARGLPSCSAGLLQSASTEEAMARCGSALVGHGRFAADVLLDRDQIPTQGPIRVFFGRRGGDPLLLLHLFGTAPVRATFVLALEISRRSEGQFGTVLSADLPRLAGGLGSITEIELQIGRQFSHRGQRHSFISASCGAPAGFGGAIFSFARASFEFRDGRTLRGTIVRDCRVR